MELDTISSYAFCSDYLFKLLLIGDSGVGKSCLLLRFAVSIFIPLNNVLLLVTIASELNVTCMILIMADIKQ